MNPIQLNLTQLMEQKTEFNLSLAIKHYISQVNSSKHAEIKDADELTNHLLSEVELLKNKGLSTEEAFFICQKRLGYTKNNSNVYHKSNPWSRMLQLMALAMVFIFGYGTILGSIKVFSVSVAVGLMKFTNIDVKSYMVWGDLVLQISFYIGAICLGLLFLKRLIGRKLKQYWPIPLIYLATLIAKKGIMFYTANINDYASFMLGSNHVNSNYIYLGWILVSVIASLWIILKNKDQRIQLA